MEKSEGDYIKGDLSAFDSYINIKKKNDRKIRKWKGKLFNIINKRNEVIGHFAPCQFFDFYLNDPQWDSGDLACNYFQVNITRDPRSSSDI